jgi:ABC-2 type transport system permease protein
MTTFRPGPAPPGATPPEPGGGAPRPAAVRRTPVLAPLRQLTLARTRVMLREPEVIFWVFFFPVLLALGLGVAFSDPAPDRLVVVIESRAGVPGVAPDPRVVDALEARTEMEVRILPPAEAERALRRGEVDLVVAPGGVVRFDPARPEGRQARAVVELALRAHAAPPPAGPTLVDEPVEQRGRRYIDWLIPGLIGFNLMSTGLWAMGFYLTQMRQSRQLKRLSATPMRRGDFLASQVLARFSFLVLEVPLIAVFAWLAFGVRVEGSLLALTAVVLLGAACFSALGLLAAIRARTVETASGIINLILLPMVVVSGVFFSPARFPDAAQPFIQALPLTALNDALRGVYNDGLPLWALGPELAILAAWTLVTFVLAVRFFRWQ